MVPDCCLHCSVFLLLLNSFPLHPARDNFHLQMFPVRSTGHSIDFSENGMSLNFQITFPSADASWRPIFALGSWCSSEWKLWNKKNRCSRNAAAATKGGIKKTGWKAVLWRALDHVLIRSIAHDANIFPVPVEIVQQRTCSTRVWI